jgi:hypothetical protein
MRCLAACFGKCFIGSRCRLAWLPAPHAWHWSLDG